MTVMFLAAMEVTIVGTAMPRVVATLGGMHLFPWVFTSYLLASTIAGPFYGKFADLLGVRRCIFASIGLFLVGSALCGFAETMLQLVLYRGLQGIGAGGISVLVYTAFGQLFPSEARGRSMGALSVVWGVASLIGPLAGGLLVTHFDWPWVFWLNLPVGLLATLLIWRHYPRHEQPIRPHRLDWLGSSLLTVGLLLTMVSLSEGSVGFAWALPAGLLLLVLFLWQQTRAAEPILPLAPLRDPRFAVPVALSFGSALTLMAVTAYVPLYLQGAMGRTATESGAAMLPMMLSWPIVSAVCGWVVNRTGFRILAVVGTLLLVAGYGLLALPLFKGASWLIAMQAMLVGAGMGMFAGMSVLAAQVAVPRHQIGAASATSALARNVGNTLGLSLLGGLQLRAFAERLDQASLTPAQQLAVTDVRSVLAQLEAGTLAPELWQAFSQAMSDSILLVFAVAFGIALLLHALSWFMSPLPPQALAAKVEAERPTP